MACRFKVCKRTRQAQSRDRAEGGRRNKSLWGRQITGSLLKLFSRGKPMEENNEELR